MNKVEINLRQKHNELRGTVKLSKDPLFNLEAVLQVTEQFAISVQKPHHEVLADLYNYVRTQNGTKK